MKPWAGKERNVIFETSRVLRRRIRTIKRGRKKESRFWAIRVTPVKEYRHNEKKIHTYVLQ